MAIQRPFPHEDAATFANMVSYTARVESLRPDLVEKDYFCTLILASLCAPDAALVFKGGTCLAKVHLSFFRLSEDLDFCIPVSQGGTRGDRRKAMVAYKDLLSTLPESVPGLGIADSLTGRNVSTQYVAGASYPSVLGARHGTIKIEIALREGLLAAPVVAPAYTLLLDALTGDDPLAPVQVKCIELGEALAEKARAALTRRRPAIRDLFDLDHAIQCGKLNPDDVHFLALLRHKLTAAGTGPIDTSPGKREELARQVSAELHPVLRPSNFEAFDLDRVWATVAQIAEAVR